MLDPHGYKGTYNVIGGEVCLDFANTVSWRGREKQHDWLHDYANYVVWGEILDLIDDYEAKQLLQRARQKPTDADAALSRAIQIRENINNIFFTLALGKSPQPHDIDRLNSFLPETLSHLQLIPLDDQFEWDWKAAREIDLNQLTWKVVWSAANLLLSDKLKRLGTCKGCDWLFIDTSRNRSRRWCSMEDCGNRAKVRRHRQHKSE